MRQFDQQGTGSGSYVWKVGKCEEMSGFLVINISIFFLSIDLKSDQSVTLQVRDGTGSTQQSAPGKYFV